MKNSKIFYFYLFFLLISLVGNSAADFAILWLGASLIENEGLGIDIVSGFYIGQSIGYILLAPYLSSYVTRFSKQKAAILIDTFYIGIYLLVIFFYSQNLLTFLLMMIMSCLLAALSSSHKNSVTFSLLNKLSNQIDIKKITEGFSYVFSGTLLLGSAVSGILFSYLGFYGCVGIALLTFLPMLVIYYVVFEKEENKKEEEARSLSVFTNISVGFNALMRNKNLFHSSIGTSIAYIPGAIYPGLIAFYGKELGESEEVISLLVSLGILFGILFIPFITKIFSDRPYRVALAFAFIPTILSLVAAIQFQNIWIFGLSFGFNCVGFNILNVITIMVRVKSVSKDEVGTLNTAYYAIMCIGQVLGTFILLPLITKNPYLALVIMTLSFFLAGLYFYSNCSKRTPSELVS